MWKTLWNDDVAIVALEYLLVATIIGLGLVVGLHAVGRALNTELVELADAIASLDQSYAFTGWSTCAASRNGSAVSDFATSLFSINCITPTAITISQAVCCP